MSKKLKRVGSVGSVWAERFGRLIFATIRKSVGLKGLKLQKAWLLHCYKKLPI